MYKTLLCGLLCAPLLASAANYQFRIPSKGLVATPASSAFSGNVTELLSIPAGKIFGTFATDGSTLVIAQGNGPYNCADANDSTLDTYALTQSSATFTRRVSVPNGAFSQIGASAPAYLNGSNVHLWVSNLCTGSFGGIAVINYTSGAVVVSNVAGVSSTAAVNFQNAGIGYLYTTESPVTNRTIASYPLPASGSPITRSTALANPDGVSGMGFNSRDGKFYALMFDRTLGAYALRSFPTLEGPVLQYNNTVSPPNSGTLMFAGNGDLVGMKVGTSGSVVKATLNSGTGSAVFNSVPLTQGGAPYPVYQFLNTAVVNTSLYLAVQQTAGGPTKIIRVD